MGGGATSIAGLRSLLEHSLGGDTFSRAHARLQTVVEEEDDDVLVADIQRILGPKRLDMLPMILKLIWLEGVCPVREGREQEADAPCNVGDRTECASVRAFRAG